MSLPSIAAVGFAGRLATAGLIVVTTLATTFAVLVGFGGAASRMLYDATALAFLVPWLVLAGARRSWLPSSRLMPAIVACLAAFAIATLTSRAPRLSLEMLGYAVLLAELYLVLVVMMRRSTLRAHFGRLALGLCVVVCGLYLLLVFQTWIEWWGLIGRAAMPPLRPAYLGLTLGSPNPVAELVLLLLGFTLARVEIGQRGARLGAIVITLVVGAVVLLTASRGAWLGAAVGLLVIVAVGIAMVPDARARLANPARRRLRVAGFAGLAVLLAAAGVLAARSGRLSLASTGRDSFAAASQRMFESSVLTGTGPGTWRVLREANTVPGTWDAAVPHAHSIYWQTLAEFGLVGVAAGLVVALSLGLLIFRALRSDDPPRRRMALAALFAVVLLAVHQVVDMFMNVPPVLLAIALPIAWLDARAPRNDAGSTFARLRVVLPVIVRRRALPLAMAVISCVIVVALFRMESSALVEILAVSAANAGNWTEATTLAGQAADADPDLAGYQFTLGVVAANAGDLSLAEHALARSTAADDDAYAWLDLAAVRWLQGDLSGARIALSRAERLGVQHPTVALPAGWLRQQLGDREAAIGDYVDALAGAPTLGGDPFWSSTAEAQEHLAIGLDRLAGNPRGTRAPRPGPGRQPPGPGAAGRRRARPGRSCAVPAHRAGLAGQPPRMGCPARRSPLLARLISIP